MSTVTPTPGFVFATVVSNNQPSGSDIGIYTPGELHVEFPKGLPIRVNVCSSPILPTPPTNSEAEIQKALAADPSSVYKIPLFLSPPVRDSQGVTFDAVVHPQPLARAVQDFDFKLYLIELCMEWVEERAPMQLSRQFTLPSIPYYGTPGAHHINLPEPQLVQEVEKTEAHTKPKALPTKQVKATVTQLNKQVDILTLTLATYRCAPSQVLVEIDPTTVTVTIDNVTRLQTPHPFTSYQSCRAYFITQNRTLKVLCPSSK
ncbi:hypothetical protein IWQ62_001077 [Dispira parvispora]|uniref:PIH1 N-terminal domain-containing protein n=1 Tax=Dispira parvispora TaxID=1520584 RepID=A0A9W8AUG7_9FUNG|nr:hypothetical protein IWQ62_001077 [Dispira parvispora]